MYVRLYVKKGKIPNHKQTTCVLCGSHREAQIFNARYCGDSTQKNKKKKNNNMLYNRHKTTTTTMSVHAIGI